jgi:multiple sugar transport system permease protein
MNAVVRLKIGKKRSRRRVRNFFLYISPWIIGFLVFTIMPMATSFVLSFTSVRIATVTSKPLEIVGFWNYRHIFSRNDVFLRSIANTFYYAVMRVGLGLVFSVLLASFFNRKMFGSKLARTLIYAPSLMPAVASALLWKVLLISDGNLAVTVLDAIGIREFSFISYSTAMPTIVFTSLIGGLGPNMIVILAALQTVPKELEEAAVIDGANAPRRFFSITIPIISSSLLFVSLTGFIGALQAYAAILLFTGGGPGNTTVTMAMQVVQNAFALDSFGMGYASAQAWILFGIILVFSLIYYKFLTKKVYYGD